MLRCVAISFLLTLSVIDKSEAEEALPLRIEVAGNWAGRADSSLTKCAEDALSARLGYSVEFQPASANGIYSPDPDFVFLSDEIGTIGYSDRSVKYKKILDAGTYRTTIASKKFDTLSLNEKSYIDFDISQGVSTVIPDEIFKSKSNVNIVRSIKDGMNESSDFIVTSDDVLPDGYKSVWQSDKIVRRPVLAKAEFSKEEVSKFQGALASSISADRDCFDLLDMAEISANQSQEILPIKPRSQFDMVEISDWKGVFGGQVSYTDVGSMPGVGGGVKVSISDTRPTKSFGVPKPDHKLSSLPIHFVTTRQRGDDLDPDRMFLNELSRDGSVSFGRIDVWIPREHVQGRTTKEKFFGGVDPELSMNVENLFVVDRDVFFRDIAHGNQPSDRREALIYVHGYANGFRDAAMRTAQLGYDLKISGPSVLFSWPSQSRVLAYSRDEDAAAATVPVLAKLLSDLHKVDNIERYYIIGHSMGARVLAEALREIEFDREKTPKFDEIVLAAPDINIHVFKNVIYPRIKKSGRKFTIYAAGNDVPLKASKVINGDAAVGSDAGFSLRLADVEIIDVSSIRECGWFCHSTYAETKIITDIFNLFKFKKRAESRQLDVIEDGFLYKYR